MKSLRNRPIGIFDSGVGGLTVARNVRKYLPKEDMIYFGDTARVPYGNKSRPTIIRFSREIMGFMMKKRVKMVIVACNTASSLSLSSLKRDYPIPVVGVIKPGVKEAIGISRNKRIGVIGTSSTISSGAYQKELEEDDHACRVFTQSCPLFVPLVENRNFSDSFTRQIAEAYLKEMETKRVDTLILGCTHYPLLKRVIGEVLNDVRLIDSSIAMAKDVKDTLVRKKLRADDKKGRATTEYYVSDDPEGFCRSAGIFLRERIKAKKVTL
ncbi:MAG: glutamate racemase [Candidatus Omnitrophota bacterium]